MRVEKNPSDLGLWADIHGKVHSIKGMAKALSLEKISVLSHAVENWCKEFQQGTIDATPGAIQSIFQGGDLLRLLVAQMGEISTAEDQRWYDSLISQFRKGPEQDASGRNRKKSLPTHIHPRAENIDYVRVKYSLIEELLGLSQEIMLLEKSLPPLSLEQISGGLRNWIDDYTSMLKGLHFRLAQLRLVSVTDFADIFVKTIRNLAKENEKEIDFEVIGGQLEADITLFERLREPFVHIFRNCIAHGIESPKEREELGKSPVGKITLEATRKGDSLTIKLSDDGRGIDRVAIAKYLSDKKSLREDEIARMSQEELFDTILSPDFSSAVTTSDMAGRGIGMNVVSQAIEYLGGALTISSEASKGTEFTIKLPVTLSIIYTITFHLGDYILSIPTLNVMSIEQTDSISPDDNNSYYDLKGILGIKNNLKNQHHILTIRHPGEKHIKSDNGGELKILVGDIIGNRQMMVMPVGELLGKSKLFSGVGIMENGEISILLDIESLP